MRTAVAAAMVGAVFGQSTGIDDPSSWPFVAIYLGFGAAVAFAYHRSWIISGSQHEAVVKLLNDQLHVEREARVAVEAEVREVRDRVENSVVPLLTEVPVALKLNADAMQSMSTSVRDLAAEVRRP